MLKKRTTLALALLLGVPGALFARPAVTPFVATQATEVNMFAALTPHQLAKSQTMMNLTMSFPYMGQHNHWYVSIFNNENSYSFITDGNENLGSIAEGTYTMEFEPVYNQGYFDILIGCNSNYIFTSHYGSSGFVRVYDQVLSQQCSHINIDKL